MTSISELETLFDDHPSLDASLRDFEGASSDLAFNSPAVATGPRFGQHPQLFPSQHSGFRCEQPSDSEEEQEEAEEEEDDEDPGAKSDGGYSPPAWRRSGRGGARSSGFWNKPDHHHHHHHPHHHRRHAALLHKAGRAREDSAEFESAEEGDATLAAAARTRLPTGSLSPEKQRSPSPDPYPRGPGDFGRTFGAVKKEEEKGVVPLASIPENPNNCKCNRAPRSWQQGIV